MHGSDRAAAATTLRPQQSIVAPVVRRMSKYGMRMARSMWPLQFLHLLRVFIPRAGLGAPFEEKQTPKTAPDCK
jgi:hypothetical protein